MYFFYVNHRKIFICIFLCATSILLLLKFNILYRKKSTSPLQNAQQIENIQQQNAHQTPQLSEEGKACNPSPLMVKKNNHHQVWNASKSIGYESLTDEYSYSSLAIDGKLPHWLSGSFIYNGPAQFKLANEQCTYWFDGFAMLHTFSLRNGTARYANKFLITNFYKQAQKTGKLAKTLTNTDENSRNPSWFSKMIALTQSPPIYDNANVNCTRIGNAIVALTETPSYFCIDPETLETKGPLIFDDSLQAHVSTAHNIQDPSSGILYNVATQFGKTNYYHVYAITPGSMQRTLVTSIATQEPSYMHSFALTKNYIILTVAPFTVNPFDLLASTKPFLLNFNWQPEKQTQFIVIDKQTGVIHEKYSTDQLFTFHHVNAYEQGNTIIIDLVDYPNNAIIKNFALNYLRSFSCSKPGNLHRYTINKIHKTVEKKLLTPTQLESPRINQHNVGSAYRYLYAVDSYDQRMLKIDLHKNIVLTWQENNCYVYEPTFVAHPEAKQEDDGVLLAIVLNAETKKSFLLVLDAHTLQEIARAHVPHHIPFGFHGNFFKC